MKAKIAAVVLVLFVPTAAHSQRSRTSADLDTRGTWTIEPIVRQGDTLPGGRRVVELGDRFWAGQAGIAFWARSEAKDKAWGLYGWRRDTVRLIGDDEVPLAGASGVPMVLHHGAGWSSAATVVLGGGDRLYLWLREGGRGFVYAWDGQRLVPVMRPGDSIEVGGARYEIANPLPPLNLLGSTGRQSENFYAARAAGDWRALDERGRAVIGFATTKPTEIQGCAVDDGDRLRVLAAAGQSLQSRDTIRSVSCEFAAVFGETIIADAKVSGKSGLARIRGNAGEMVYYAGQPHPGIPGKKMNLFWSGTYIVGADKIVYVDNDGSWLIRAGEWTPLVARGSPLNKIVDVRETDPDGPGLLLVRNDDKNLVQYSAYIQQGKEKRYLRLFDTHVLHSLFCFDGQTLSEIAWNGLVPQGAYGSLLILPHAAVVPGIIFQIGIRRDVSKKEFDDISKPYWLRPSGRCADVVPLPGFTLADGRMIYISSLMGTPAPGEAIVSLRADGLGFGGDQGLFHLKRQ